MHTQEGRCKRIFPLLRFVFQIAILFRHSKIIKKKKGILLQKCHKMCVFIIEFRKQKVYNEIKLRESSENRKSDKTESEV